MFQAELPPQETLNPPAQIRELVDASPAPLPPAPEKAVATGAPTSSSAGLDSDDVALDGANRALSFPRAAFDDAVLDTKTTREQKEIAMNQFNRAIEIIAEIEPSLVEILAERRPIVLISRDLPQSYEKLTGLSKEEIPRTTEALTVKGAADGGRDVVLISLRMFYLKNPEPTGITIGVVAHEARHVAQDSKTLEERVKKGLYPDKEAAAETEAAARNIVFLEKLMERRPELKATCRFRIRGEELVLKRYSSSPQLPRSNENSPRANR